MAKAKHPQPPMKVADDFFDAPTRKQNALPADLREPVLNQTTKVPRAEIEAILMKEREGSGMRAAITDEDIERHERRACETVPAPPTDEAQPLELELDDLLQDDTEEDAPNAKKSSRRSAPPTGETSRSPSAREKSSG